MPTADACVLASESAAAVSTTGTSIAIAAVDDRFEPSCILVEPGPVTLVVRNAGSHPHDITVPGWGSKVIDAGQVAFLAITVGVRGVEFTCELHPGMTGVLATPNSR